MSWTDKQREAFESNRLSWDERVEAHWESDMYQRHAADLRAGRAALREDMLDGVGDVTGQSLVHLQCHMGMETLSWALLGRTWWDWTFHSRPSRKPICFATNSS